MFGIIKRYLERKNAYLHSWETPVRAEAEAVRTLIRELPQPSLSGNCRDRHHARCRKQCDCRCHTVAVGENA